MDQRLRNKLEQIVATIGPVGETVREALLAYDAENQRTERDLADAHKEALHHRQLAEKAILEKAQLLNRALRAEAERDALRMPREDAAGRWRGPPR